MMERAIVFALLSAGILNAQLGRTTDWIGFGGDAQRDGFEKNEQKFVKEDVKDFRLLWQRKLDNPTQGVGALLPPVILGQLIGYRGFKELAFVAGSGNSFWSMDSDLDRLYWEKQFDTSGKGKKVCGGSLTAMPALPAPVVFRMPPPAPAVGTSASPAPARRNSAGNSFMHPHPVYLLTGDGMLRRLQQADGSDLAPPLQFIPPNAVAQSLNVFEETLYTTTRSACGQEASIWSVDTQDPAAKVKSAKLGANVVGLGGVALGSDGTAFVETDGAAPDPANGKFSGAVVALNQNLAVSQYFTLPSAGGVADMNATSPVVFTFKGSEYVATAGKDGRLYLLKAASVGGDDHHHYLSNSMVLPASDAKNERGIWGSLASWEDADGARYLLAPIWGPLSAELQAAIPGTASPHGSIVALKVDDKDGVPTLTPVWVSRDLESPAPPVIAKGVIFALSNGKFSWSAKQTHGTASVAETPAKGTHATLFAFDGITGKEMYSTGDQVKTAGNLTGLSIANGRLYFVTVDNTIQVFGKYLER